MTSALREFVIQRADNRCEYCHLSQADTLLPHELEHIIARQHHGLTEENNLCFACYFCNRYKGPNLAGVDLKTTELVRLFHPRVDQWDEHFEWDQSILKGLTSIGRVTVDVLKIDLPQRVILRRKLSPS